MENNLFCPKCKILLSGCSSINITIQWPNSVEYVNSFLVCPTCFMVYTKEAKLVENYKNFCWYCGKKVGKTVNNLRCIKCGYYVCPECFSHKEGCEGFLTKEQIKFYSDNAKIIILENFSEENIALLKDKNPSIKKILG